MSTQGNNYCSDCTLTWSARHLELFNSSCLALLQAPPVKKQRTGFTDENQRWLKPKAGRGAAAEPAAARKAKPAQPDAELGGDSDSGA